MAAGLTAEQLRTIDGIVCVGGDGIFHETFNGLLEARAAAAASTESGAVELAALLSSLRLAHIPAGSTDAVACTLHGSRSPFTAAVHVCLGDSCLLDVLRVDTASATKFASCIAAYGFLADVTSAAESYRFLGPMRYDLVGTVKLLASRAYPARVRYIEGEVGRALRKHGSTVCGAGCSVCRAASFMHSRRMSEAQLAQANGSSSSAPGSPRAQASLPGQASPAASAAPSGMAAAAAAAAAASGSAGLPAAPSSASLGSSLVRSEPPSPAAHTLTTAGSLGPASPHFVLPAADAAERQGGEEWRELEGEFNAIMCIVMPCRSDKTKKGMVRYGHLCDGRLKLVLVSKCSPLQYLRFLLHMSRHGCAPGALKYVTVLDAVAVQVEPLGAAGQVAGGSNGQQQPCSKLSCWNLDGELLPGPDQSIAAEVHPGLLRVFSRGVEQ
jgi:diacylglycerol kinase family enzyme